MQIVLNMALAYIHIQTAHATSLHQKYWCLSTLMTSHLETQKHLEVSLQRLGLTQILKSKLMDVSENSGTPKSSILKGFSIINHPFWGTPIFGNTHICCASKYEIHHTSFRPWPLAEWEVASKYLTFFIWSIRVNLYFRLLLMESPGYGDSCMISKIYPCRKYLTYNHCCRSFYND